MLDLGRLSVSLTKHGAHKLALLLAKYDKDDILNRLWDEEPGINIETAQAKKNLSVNSSGVVLSYNNLVDVDAAVNLVQEFEGETAFVIIKHTNACGAATAPSVMEAYLKAFHR